MAPASSDSGSMEDLAYTAKVRRLRAQYAGPLQRFIQNVEKVPKTGDANGRPHNNKLLGVCRKVLNLLQNPQQRYPMSTIRCYETILRRLFVPKSGPLTNIPAPQQRLPTSTLTAPPRLESPPRKMRRQSEGGKFPPAGGIGQIQPGHTQVGLRPNQQPGLISRQQHVIECKQSLVRKVKEKYAVKPKTATTVIKVPDVVASHDKPQPGHPMGCAPAPYSAPSSTHTGLSGQMNAVTSATSGKGDPSVTQVSRANSFRGSDRSKQTTASDRTRERAETVGFNHQEIASDRGDSVNCTTAGKRKYVASISDQYSGTGFNASKSESGEVGSGVSKAWNIINTMKMQSRKRIYEMMNGTILKAPDTDGPTVFKQTRSANSTGDLGLDPGENTTGSNIHDVPSTANLSTKVFYGKTQKSVPTATISKCGAVKAPDEVSQGPSRSSIGFEKTLRIARKKLLAQIADAKRRGLKLSKNYVLSLRSQLQNHHSSTNLARSVQDKKNNQAVSKAGMTASATQAKAWSDQSRGHVSASTSAVCSSSETKTKEARSPTTKNIEEALYSSHANSADTASGGATMTTESREPPTQNKSQAKTPTIQASTSSSSASKSAGQTGKLPTKLLKSPTLQAKNKMPHFNSPTIQVTDCSLNASQTNNTSSASSVPVRTPLPSLAKFSKDQKISQIFPKADMTKMTKKTASPSPSATRFHKSRSSISATSASVSSGANASTIAASSSSGRTPAEGTRTPTVKNRAQEVLYNSLTIQYADSADTASGGSKITSTQPRTTTTQIKNQAKTPTTQMRTSSRSISASSGQTSKEPIKAMKSPTLHVKGKMPQFKSPTRGVTETDLSSDVSSNASEGVRTPASSVKASPASVRTPSYPARPSYTSGGISPNSCKMATDISKRPASKSTRTPSEFNRTMYVSGTAAKSADRFSTTPAGVPGNSYKPASAPVKRKIYSPRQFPKSLFSRPAALDNCPAQDRVITSSESTPSTPFGKPTSSDKTSEARMSGSVERPKTQSTSVPARLQTSSNGSVPVSCRTPTNLARTKHIPPQNESPGKQPQRNPATSTNSTNSSAKLFGTSFTAASNSVGADRACLTPGQRRAQRFRNFVDPPQSIPNRESTCTVSGRKSPASATKKEPSGLEQGKDDTAKFDKYYNNLSQMRDKLSSTLTRRHSATGNSQSEFAVKKTDIEKYLSPFMKRMASLAKAAQDGHFLFHNKPQPGTSKTSSGTGTSSGPEAPSSSSTMPSRSVSNTASVSDKRTLNTLTQRKYRSSTLPKPATVTSLSTPDQSLSHSNASSAASSRLATVTSSSILPSNVSSTSVATPSSQSFRQAPATATLASNSSTMSASTGTYISSSADSSPPMSSYVSVSNSAVLATESASSGSKDPASDNDSECIVCFENPVNTVIYSCGHMCLCFQCAGAVKEKKKECPVCREPIKDIIKIFKT